MWSKWWRLHRKESFDVTASGSGVLYPPVTDCKMAYRLIISNTLPALQFRHLKFISEDKHFTWYLYFHTFSYFSLFHIFELLQRRGTSCFNPINKHPHRCRRLTSAGRIFVTCDVTTDDGAALYVYVTKYAAIHCKGKYGRDPRLNPSALLIFVTGS